MANRRAFSIVEIIVTIILIVILATLTVFSLKSRMARTMDMQRVDDIKQIQQALDIYRQKTGHYPLSLTSGLPLIGPDGQVILKNVPTSPTPSDCRIPNYTYISLDNGLSYNLIFCLADQYSDIPAGRCVANPTSFCNVLGESCLSVNCIWQYIATRGISGGPSDSTTLTTNKFAKLYVAYRDGSIGGKVNVMTYDFSHDGSWTGVQSASLLSQQVGQAAFPVISNYNHDNDNKYIYLAFSDMGDGGRPKVLVNQYTTNNPWIAVNNGLPTTKADYLSLLVDKKVAYLAFEDVAQGGKATVMKNTNLGTWTLVGNRGFSAGAASEISLDLSTSLYIAYRDETIEKAMVYKYSNGNWNKVGTSAAASLGNASSISLTIFNGQPCIGYVDYTVNHKATVMCYNGSSWLSLGAPGFSAGQVDNTTLASYGNDLYIAYLDKYNGSRITVLKWSGTTWLPVGPAGFSPTNSSDPSLTLYDNNLYVGFTDPVFGGKISIMGYQ